MKPKSSRIRPVTAEEFKALLRAKAIRPASLEDVCGTHHSRPLVRHPNTKEFFVMIGEVH